MNSFSLKLRERCWRLTDFGKPAPQPYGLSPISFAPLAVLEVNHRQMAGSRSGQCSVSSFHPQLCWNVPLPAVPAPDALRCLSAEVPRFTWCPGDHTHRDLEVPARTQLSFHVSSPCGILFSSLQALGSCRDTFLQALSWLWRRLGSLIQPHMPCAFNTVYELLSADKD